MIEEGMATFDQAKRDEISVQIQKQFMEDVAMVPVSVPGTHLVYRNNLKGVYYHPSDHYMWWPISKA